MQNPKDFTRVLYLGMGIVTAFYISMGTIGYIGFGEHIRGSITLNLPLCWWVFVIPHIYNKKKRVILGECTIYQHHLWSIFFLYISLYIHFSRKYGAFPLLRLYIQMGISKSKLVFETHESETGELGRRSLKWSLCPSGKKLTGKLLRNRAQTQKHPAHLNLSTGWICRE